VWGSEFTTKAAIPLSSVRLFPDKFIFDKKNKFVWEKANAGECRSTAWGFKNRCHAFV
jgi:hypothetical protein